ncbi:MAG TPA: 50S ribosomal protein L11 methyltransferase [Gemmatimonadaceae bacterium]
MTADAASWVEIRISGARKPEAVIAALLAEGSQGVQELGAEILTWFPSVSSAERIREVVVAADPAARVATTAASPHDWSDSRAAVKVQRLGRLTVAPPWLVGILDPSTTVVIDPAMAFGTGEHATTRGVIRLMQTISLKGSVVADLGAGSAILSIAAAKLGARRAVAIEMDPDASGNALDNIHSNGVGDRVHFIEGDAFVLLPLIAPVDAILANILSSVLVNLLPVMRDSLAPAGHAILSGMLREERATMLNEIERGGWQVDREDTEDEWWSVLISRA